MFHRPNIASACQLVVDWNRIFRKYGRRQISVNVMDTCYLKLLSCQKQSIAAWALKCWEALRLQKWELVYSKCDCNTNVWSAEFVEFACNETHLNVYVRIRWAIRFRSHIVICSKSMIWIMPIYDGLEDSNGTKCAEDFIEQAIEIVWQNREHANQSSGSRACIR